MMSCWDAGMATYGAPNKAELNSHDDITADAVRPVPTLRFATMYLYWE